MEGRDHVDRFLDSLSPELAIDRQVEGIVDRIGGLSRRIKRSAEADEIAEFGLGYGEWHLLARLHNQGPRLSPGVLAKRLELSSGAIEPARRPRARPARPAAAGPGRPPRGSSSS